MNKKIILQPEVSVTATDYELIVYNESVINKFVKAKVNLIADDLQKYDYPEFVLWQDDDYINIGDWTDAQARTRIEEILNQ